MVVIITGASHTGKTALAQKILEKYKFPYFSLDHLKMGLIRSGNTSLTPLSGDAKLTEYLWPIVCEIIKTAIENEQNLVVEGCYIPSDWFCNFDKKYLDNIKCYLLVMSKDYINNHFDDIVKYANVVERRVDDDCSPVRLIKENEAFLSSFQSLLVNCIQIDKAYNVDIEL